MKVTVREGDTLLYFSQVFDVPLPLVIASNPKVDPERLEVGQKLSIPGYVKQTVTIKKGDTFWSIATERQIPLDALILMNPETDPHNLKIGEAVYVPIRITRPIIKTNQPYDYAMMLKDINRLQAVYPFITQESIGRSVLGKSIPEVTVGHGPKKLHVNGSFHAREWITTPVTMLFLNEYLLALTNRRTMRGLSVAPFYEETTLSIVPMVNPDGVDLAIHGLEAAGNQRESVLNINKGSSDFSKWKANIKGVDLNNQIPAGWEIEAERKEREPSPENYPGPSPLSEPESKAMVELAREKQFDRIIALHTQGEEIYWGYEGREPVESEAIAKEFARVSGYAPVRNLDSHAGYKDWFIDQWQRPGFTVELGRGEHPLPLEQFNEIYQKTLGIFLANFYM
ncbi:g-D-glutamyl-meso-diaminopimelate peptidase [Pullulanibacillus pueri]|uniref:Peptidase M14 n=1 Tax=Pullulanibacillus pueri TaxID=1437324 RepID=A0A8J2ZUX3_9BACL|nr:M14 family metallopeptidase [Pullulanibacillus pueri]MBM7681543.1 g-D-glutamyl-meso-diaminopimelate peptidase [Pullulanibacillus pueri]GGH79738.1 hypothetical protein GCM10007096_15110 [Pullulanibacillus pueri]